MKCNFLKIKNLLLFCLLAILLPVIAVMENPVFQVYALWKIPSRNGSILGLVRETRAGQPTFYLLA